MVLEKRKSLISNLFNGIQSNETCVISLIKYVKSYYFRRILISFIVCNITLFHKAFTERK